MTIETTLPVSGKTAVMRRVTGHDIVQAEILCGSGEVKPAAFQLALVSRVTIIDGKTLPYEDFLDMDSEDLNHLGKLEVPRPEASPAPPESF